MECADREYSAKSVPSKTLNRRERRGTQRKHISGFSAVVFVGRALPDRIQPLNMP